MRIEPKNSWIYSLPSKQINGVTVYKTVVPKTGEIRWIDPNQTKDFNGIVGYRFYNDNGILDNQYTQALQEENKQLKDNQPVYGETNQAANERADEYANRVSLTPERFAGMLGASVPLAAGALGATVAAPVVFNKAILPLADYVGGTSVGKFITKGLTNPYFTKGMESAFAAHGMHHAVNEGIKGPVDAITTALEITPLAQPLYKGFNYAWKAMPQINKTAIQKLNNLYDPYTSFSARFGYYGNPIERFYGTMARRFNLPDKARLPELIRKSKIKDIQTVGNEILISRPATHHRATDAEFQNITNFTYDRPVVSHSAGNWDNAKATFVVNPKRVLERETFGGIEPSDAFLIDNGHLTLPPKDVTVISGDVKTLNNARKQGIKTLSSKRARQLYESEQKKISESEARRLADIDEAVKNNADKYTIWGLKIRKPYSGDFSEYAKEIERLQGLRGRPFIKDVKLLENNTGLNAGVAPISSKLPFMNQVASFMNNPSNVKAPSYPNGRTFELNDPIDRGSYKYLFYDPSTYAEALYRKSLSK